MIHTPDNAAKGAKTSIPVIKPRSLSLLNRPETMGNQLRALFPPPGERLQVVLICTNFRFMNRNVTPLF